MTVSYAKDVANAGDGFGCFSRILTKWKGSVYKLIYRELLVYIIMYFVLNLIYRTFLLQEGYEWYRHLFESLTAFCQIQMSSIPMTFGLGFYVSLIVKRWWDQYTLLPYPDSLAIFVVGLIRGLDERGRLIRRNIMRYILLSYVVTLRRISSRVKNRFPDLSNIVEAGLMREDEMNIIENLNEKSTISKWWIPLVWATNIVETARQEQRLNNDPGMQTILNEISSIRKGLTGVQYYDTISVPLVYTQVVTLAVYIYFSAALMGAQWVTFSDPEDYFRTYKLPTFESATSWTSFNDTNGREHGRHHHGQQLNYQPLDLYVPIFLILQFIFYVGWLKVAETLINPFGEDDDDFELNYLIDRHIQVSYLIVDDMHQDFPELLKDIHWNQAMPTVLPSTQEVEPKGSAEMKDEADNSSTYYKFLYPLFKPAKTAKTPLGAKSSLPHQDSEYESIEQDIFHKVRAKLRKSQMRRPISKTNDDSNSIYYAPRRKLSVDQRSIKSQRSAYSRITSRLWRSTRNKEKLVHKSLDPEESGGGKNVQDSVGGTPKKKISDSSTTSWNLYGDLGSIDLLEAEEQRDEAANDQDMMVQKLKEMPHLSTITEQNSPNSTTHIRSLSRSRPVIPEIFKESNLEEQVVITEQESNAYYPIGSADSSQRPISPRFMVEEVPNYEPILISKGQVIYPFQEDPKQGDSDDLAIALAKTDPSNNERETSASPALPRRKPIFSYDNLDHSKPETLVTEVTNSEKSSSNSENTVMSDNDDSKKDKTQGDLTKQKPDAISAFDNATFYV